MYSILNQLTLLALLGLTMYYITKEQKYNWWIIPIHILVIITECHNFYVLLTIKGNEILKFLYILSMLCFGCILYLFIHFRHNIE